MIKAAEDGFRRWERLRMSETGWWRVLVVAEVALAVVAGRRGPPVSSWPSSFITHTRTANTSSPRVSLSLQKKKNKQHIVEMSSPLPAHETKHISQLQYPFRTSVFHLTQLDNGLTNGTGLWLGAQCLSLFLADIYGRTVLRSTRPRAIELGSGIGLSALVSLSFPNSSHFSEQLVSLRHPPTIKLYISLSEKISD